MSPLRVPSKPTTPPHGTTGSGTTVAGANAGTNPSTVDVITSVDVVTPVNAGTAGAADAFDKTAGTHKPPSGQTNTRPPENASIELPIRALLATAKADRAPKAVAGVLVDHDGKTTFRPADESLTSFDLDAAAVHDLPRGVVLVARATQKQMQIQLPDSLGGGSRSVAATIYKLAGETAPSLKGTFTGVVDLIDGKAFLRDLVKQPPTYLPLPATSVAALAPGSVVAAHMDRGTIVVDDLLAPGGTAEARSWTVAEGLHLDPTFSAEALTEAKTLANNPGLDDPALVDLTADPFFAIDNIGSRDIDQAMRLVKKPDGGFILHYALADMSHAVKPGMALFDEAMQRGASYYIPGVSVPMQPRDVCERAVSLNAHEVHKALVVSVELDKDGKVTKTTAVHAKIKSQAQLTYPGVTAMFEQHKSIEIDEHGTKVPPAVIDQLQTFKDIGEVLRGKARERGVVDPERRELRIGLKGSTFYIHEADDDLASRLNAELSIIANVASANMLSKPDVPGLVVPGIYRIHPPPSPDKREGLRRQIAAIVDGNGAPASWKWQKQESLTAWVDKIKALPTTPRERALAGALQSQVLSIQVSSEYARTPGLHSGLMVEGYGRFSAPMREVVGILSHATLFQLESYKRIRAALGVDDAQMAPLWTHMLVGAVADPKQLDPQRAALAKAAAGLEGLRGDALKRAAADVLAQVRAAPAFDDGMRIVDAVFMRALESGNASRMKQKQVDGASVRLLFDDLFLRDLHGVPEGDPQNPAPVRRGTVTGAQPGKLTIRLDEPDVEVKIGRDDLTTDGTIDMDKDGAELVITDAKGQTKRVLIGQEIQVRATHHDGEKLHFSVA